MTEGPKLIACHEDDDFMATLDKLMADDTLPGSVKGGAVDAAIPLHLKGGGANIKTGASILVFCFVRVFTFVLILYSTVA